MRVALVELVGPSDRAQVRGQPGDVRRRRIVGAAQPGRRAEHSRRDRACHPSAAMSASTTPTAAMIGRSFVPTRRRVRVAAEGRGAVDVAVARRPAGPT